jgi:hypothetical protein
MTVSELALRISNFLMLQTLPSTTEGTKKVFSYDTAYSHKEGNKKFYTISYVHNRDIVPGVAIQQTRKIKHTIV